MVFNLLKKFKMVFNLLKKCIVGILNLLKKCFKVLLNLFFLYGLLVLLAAVGQKRGYPGLSQDLDTQVYILKSVIVLSQIKLNIFI